MAEDYTSRATCECYYKFENSSDLGEDNQNQIDLTNNNSVSQSSDVPSGTYADPSAANSAHFVRTSSQYLSANHADSTEVDDLTALTAICWAKFDSISNEGYMLAKTDTPNSDGWTLNFVTGGGGMLSTWFQGQYNQYAHGFSVDTWYFLATVYNGDHLILYKGTESGQVSVLNDKDVTNSLTAATTAGFNIGTYNTSYIDGYLCEVAVFSEALNLSDLEDIQQYGIDGSGAGLSISATEDKPAPEHWLKHKGILKE